jgi:CBS domain-containing protein
MRWGGLPFAVLGREVNYMTATDLRTVDDVMTRRLATVAESDLVTDAERGMLRLRVRHLPVVDGDGYLVGLVSQGDILHAASSFLSEREADRSAVRHVSVDKIMQPEVLTVQPGDSLVQAGKLMWESKVSCLPVVDPDGILLGILTEADFIRVALELLGSPLNTSDIEELARARAAAGA